MASLHGTENVRTERLTEESAARHATPLSGVAPGVGDACSEA